MNNLVNFIRNQSSTITGKLRLSFFTIISLIILTGIITYVSFAKYIDSASLLNHLNQLQRMSILQQTTISSFVEGKNNSLDAYQINSKKIHDYINTISINERAGDLEKDISLINQLEQNIKNNSLDFLNDYKEAQKNYDTATIDISRRINGYITFWITTDSPQYTRAFTSLENIRKERALVSGYSAISNDAESDIQDYKNLSQQTVKNMTQILQKEIESNALPKIGDPNLRLKLTTFNSVITTITPDTFPSISEEQAKILGIDPLSHDLNGEDAYKATNSLFASYGKLFEEYEKKSPVWKRVTNNDLGTNVSQYDVITTIILREQSAYSNALKYFELNNYYADKIDPSFKNIINTFETQRVAVSTFLLQRGYLLQGVTLASALLITFIGLVLSNLIQRVLIKPIIDLKNISQEMAKGNLSKRLVLSTKDEFGDLAETFNEMADRLQVANTQQQKKEFELSQEIEESQKKNKTLEDTKTAMLSILEDARQLEDDLKDERDKAKAIISAMSEGLIVVNESQTIILINPAGEKLLGLAENQIIGKKIDDVIQIYKGTQRLANSDRPVTKVFKTGKAITTTTSDDYFYQSAGRKRFPVLMTASPLMRDSIFGVVETFRDITDLRNYEDALQQAKTNIERKVEERTAQVQEEHARLEASIESLSAGFIMTDISYHAVMVNASAKRMLKLINYDAPHYGDMRSLLSINKQLILDLIEEKLGGVFSLKQHLQECLDTKKTMIIKDVLYEGRYFNIFIAPIIIYRAKIEAIGCVTLIEDVTEVKIIDRSKDEFFSIASHELRTPLTAIRGNTSMIKQFYADQLKDDDLKSMIDDIHESSIRLIKIVNDFLNTSRLEQGRMEFKKETFDLLELIRGSIADIESMLKEKNLYLKIENPQDLGHSIYADKDRVKEVVLNLFGNAMKFTEQGGITVHVTQHDQLIKVSITDTGKGVPLSNQSLLFRKFQQASNNILTRDTTRSTGLGLYISKLMIEGMGGKIYLERSEEGKGATFSFELPVDDSIDRKNETKEV